MERIIQFMQKAYESGLYPRIPMLDTAPSDPVIEIGGIKYINFASNNYLGLANHKEVKRATIKALKKYGIGACASRLAIGNTKAHVDLEKKLSKFIGVEDAVVTTSGYLTNVGVIPAVMDKIFIFDQKKLEDKDFGIIFSDERNHASIVDGVRLSHAEKVIYKHNNIEDLVSKIKIYINRRKLIVSDAIFSVDGDIAPLKDLVYIKQKYGAILMIDEAHSFGVLGSTGRGISEHFNINPELIDINMGTLSKALGSVGGYIAGKKRLIDYIRVTALPFVLTAGPLPPALAEGAIKALDIIEKNPDLIRKLKFNVTYIKNGLRDLNVSYKSDSQIIMIPIGDERKLLEIIKLLGKNGILVSAMRYPAVPWGDSRIRISIMSTHNKKEMDKLLFILNQTRAITNKNNITS